MLKLQRRSSKASPPPPPPPPTVPSDYKLTRLNRDKDFAYSLDLQNGVKLVLICTSSYLRHLFIRYFLSALFVGQTLASFSDVRVS